MGLWVRLIGAAPVIVALLLIFSGLLRGVRKPVGRRTARAPGYLRRPGFYLAAAVGYFGLCYLLWLPLPWKLSVPLEAIFLLPGSTLYFSGFALIVWGRLALGAQYGISSSLGAQLQAGHELVTTGPYAFIRHPMYAGILLAGIGGLLIYQTWTMVFIIANFPALVARAYHEEQLLSAEFGERWDKYSRRVPAWLPRPGKSR